MIRCIFFLLLISFILPAHAEVSLADLQVRILRCSEQLDVEEFEGLTTDFFEEVNGCSAVFAVLIERASRKEVRFSPEQKVLFLERSKTVLQRVKELKEYMDVNAEWEASHHLPARSLLAFLENQIIQYSLLLAKKDTWSVSYGLGMGTERFYNKEQIYLVLADAGVFIDLGQDFDLKVTLRVSSPLKEENNLSDISLIGGDFFTFGETWILFKRYQNFQLKFGMFPDHERNAAPSATWPFITAQGRIHLVNLENFQWTLRVRQDTLGIYSHERHQPDSIIVERNFSETAMEGELTTKPVTFRMRLSAGVHWYTDTEGVLPSLSITRTKYFKENVTASELKYRVSDFQLRTGFYLDSGLFAEMRGSLLSNFYSTMEQGGYYWAGKLGGRSGAYQFNAMLESANLQCGVAPPIHFNTWFYPGMRSTDISLGNTFGWSSDYSATFFGKYKTSLQSTASRCNPATEQDYEHYIPRWMLGITFNYSLGQSYQEPIL